MAKFLENDSSSMSEARDLIFGETASGAIRGLGEPQAASARPRIDEIAPSGGEEAVYKSKSFR